MPSFVHSVIGLAGIIVSCCAVTISLTFNATQTSSGGGDNKAPITENVSMTSELTPSKSLTFEDLGNQIVVNWKEKQSHSSQGDENLSGKNNLQRILSENKKPEHQTGIIKSYDGKNCVVSQVGRSTDCGYIHLNGENVDYKLKIQYEYWGEPQKNKGRIYIVKDNQGKVSYYDNINNHWSEKNQIRFENLNSFSTTSNDEGNLVTAPAFIQSAKV